MLVPPTFSWMSRATMPCVSVTTAWARETPGVSTPPTVVKAPNLRTSRRLSGLNIVPSFAIGKGWANLVESAAAILQWREPAMKLPGFVSRAMSLREAAAVIFVLIALLPLLLFVSVISVSGLISKTEAQFAAFMAVAIACLGFVVFRRLVDQIVRLATRLRLPTGAGDAILGPSDARRSPRIDRAPRGSRVQARHPARAGRAFRAYRSDRRAAPRVPPDHRARGAGQWRRHPPPR